MRHAILLAIFTTVVATSSWAADCVKPTDTLRNPESPVALSMAVISGLATAHAAYQESPLSPERSVRGAGARPLAEAKRCVDAYISPFRTSETATIQSAAQLLGLAMSILESNETDIIGQLGQMSEQGATSDQMMNRLIEYRDSAMGRWSIFVNVALETAFSISRFEDVHSPKSALILTLQADEAMLLRMEILRHFALSRLVRPGALANSPEKGAAMLYQLLNTGRLDVGTAEWK